MSTKSSDDRDNEKPPCGKLRILAVSLLWILKNPWAVSMGFPWHTHVSSADFAVECHQKSLKYGLGQAIGQGSMVRLAATK
jgi:hypothetical protein